MSSITELTVVTGDHYRVEGEAKHVERVILDAARGSIVQLAWLVDAETGEDFAVNPRLRGDSASCRLPKQLERAARRRPVMENIVPSRLKRRVEGPHRA